MMRRMDRAALLIDAGYLLLGAGGLVLGAERREEIECDYGALLDALIETVEDHSRLPILRSYWYDGAPGHGEPTAEHRRIGSLPGLKLRLGRVVQGQQKGVDTLITLDLLTLARERAAASVYLLTGDEDLREPVVAAQSLGLQIVLVGAPPMEGSRQSYALIDECDEHLVLGEEFWSQYFTRSLRQTRAFSPPPSGELGEDASEEERAYRFGVRYCEFWASETDAEQMRHVAERLPTIPVDIDAPMLRAAETELGSLREREDLRRTVRQGFTEQFQLVAAGHRDGYPDDDDGEYGDDEDDEYED